MTAPRTPRRPIVLVEFSPSGGLFQFAVQLGDALATEGEHAILLTGPEPELTATQDAFEIRSVLPTWHPADHELHSPTLRRVRRVLRAGQLVLAWLVLGAHLARMQPRAVLWSHWRFTFEPLFVRVIRVLLPRTTLGIVAHEPLPRSDARDTSTPKSGRLLEASFGAAWRCLDVAFVLGEDPREVVLRHWRPTASVTVIPHGDEGVLLGGTPIPVADTDPVVLFFGTWTSYKGIDVLLEAFALVRAQLPEARLILAGAVGADVDLSALLAAADAVGNVEARPGYVPIDDVRAYLDRTRVVVTPYVRATQSGVVHLAYTFGRPVVGTTVGAIPESVIDGETGLLVPPGDPRELASALLRLLTDAGLASRLGTAGRQVVASAWQTAAQRVATAIDDARKGSR